ncbi:MAG: hypothetical protein NT145_08265, partial [Elusimicrobia bacterium]|nr:hypothetical protein [Elusimicrobiota bacterium]
MKHLFQFGLLGLILFIGASLYAETKEMPFSAGAKIETVAVQSAVSAGSMINPADTVWVLISTALVMLM